MVSFACFPEAGAEFDGMSRRSVEGRAAALFVVPVNP
jgi:hypothetical protein